MGKWNLSQAFASVIENERFGRVYKKNGSINSGTMIERKKR
jgi:hypothetical protein